jgi:hypothetical protein
MEVEMKGRLLLDVVIRQCTTILKLLAGKNKASLIIRGGANFMNKDAGW